MMDRRISWQLLIVLIFIARTSCNFNPFMDSIYFSIEWAEPDLDLTSHDAASTDDPLSVVMTTRNNEKYRCVLPLVAESGDNKDSDHNVAAAFEMDLLKSLFDQTTCTYRLEMYWTYELCHGRLLRQYHEEKEIGKKTKLSEYFLGRYSTEKYKADYARGKEEYATDNKKSYQKKKVQGTEIPYYEVMFSDGTLCDLTGQPRRAAIHYVCQPDGRGEIYEIKETSSCEYEVIVLTHLLCSHPVYGPKKEVVNTIQCRSLDGAPHRPDGSELFDMKRDQFNSRQFWNAEKTTTDDDDEDDDEDESEEPTKPTSSTKPEPPPRLADDERLKQVGDRADKEFIKNFLNGDACIHGGTGWWKHEFCYGRHVKQYHEERFQKTVILLGEWDRDAHVSWIRSNPNKQPASVEVRKSLRHLYTGGNVCDLTGQPRIVEVKLTCIGGASKSHAMGIYIVEPKPCQYKLVVESPLLCSIINLADSDGLIPIPND